MFFKPKMWYRVALGLTVLNLVGLGWAVRPPTEPMHAATHAVLAVLFGFWARRLRRDPGMSDDETRLSGEDRVEELASQVSYLRQELSETQERLDFAERLLARAPEKERGA